MPKRKNLIGQRFGLLTVVALTDQIENNYVVWRCKCDCGGEILVNTKHLMRHTITNCGCIPKTNAKRGSIAEDLTGQVFGDLTVLHRTESLKGRTRWVCQCSCGNQTIVTTRSLKEGKVKSCGCKQHSYPHNIADISGMPLVREENTSLNGIELVTTVPRTNVAFYERCRSYVSFFLKLKVPKASERHMDDGKHFTKSNINVCYAAPRSKRKARDWFETQLTVGADVYKMDGYPEKNKPFYVVTDDGYWFKAHTTSDNNKQFSAVGDELIMGRWLKGRLAAAGIVKPVNNTAEDTERNGMITQEMLDEYGCDRLLFKKTGQTALDENGNPLDVWLLSFVGQADELGGE